MVNLNQSSKLLAKMLIRRENLIALLETGVEFLMQGFTEEIRDNMLNQAYYEKQLLQTELGKRTKAKQLEEYLNQRDHEILYSTGAEQLKQKGMPAPLSFIGGAPKQAGQ